MVLQCTLQITGILTHTLKLDAAIVCTNDRGLEVVREVT
jgi:hypothetical protein